MAFVASLLACLSVASAGMDEVPPYSSYRIAPIESGTSAMDLLVVRTRPMLELGRWSTTTGRPSWFWCGSPANRWSCAAVCAVRDQNGDEREDWALVRTYVGESHRATSCSVTIGCGVSGATIRSTNLDPVGREVGVCHVRSARNGCDLVLGCPKSQDGAGEVVWMRTDDLSVCGRMAAPAGARSFGQFVGAPLPGSPAVWVSAPDMRRRWAVWSCTSFAASSRSLIVHGERGADGEPWWEDPSRSYGSWVSTSPDATSSNRRTISVGAAGYPAVGRVATGRVGEWRQDSWVDGPVAPFGSHLGAVVLVIDDVDGDRVPDTIVTDPGLLDSLRPERAFVGGFYLLRSSDRALRCIATGEDEMDFLGIGLVPVGDVSADCKVDVAALALPNAHTKHPYVELWSVQSEQRLATIRITPASEW